MAVGDGDGEREGNEGVDGEAGRNDGGREGGGGEPDERNGSRNGEWRGEGAVSLTDSSDESSRLGGDDGRDLSSPKSGDVSKSDERVAT